MVGYLVLIVNALDIAKANAWLLYRRFCSQFGISNRRQMALLTFSSRLAEALIKRKKSGSVPRRVGRLAERSSSLDNQQTPKTGRAPESTLPHLDARFSLAAHWPEYRDTKNKCRS